MFDEKEILEKMTKIKDYNEIGDSLLNKNLLRILSNQNFELIDWSHILHQLENYCKINDLT